MARDYSALATPKEPRERKPRPQLVSTAKLFVYANVIDFILMTIGTLSSIAMGVSQPAQVVIFGDIINAFNPKQSQNINSDTLRRNINDVVLRLVVLASIVMVCGVAQIACWSITAARQAKRIRHAYVIAILRQEVGWFDVNDPMQLATRVADTTLIIQDGMGRKVGDSISFFSMAVAGIVIAFTYGWELALVLLAFTPLIAASGYCTVQGATKATQATLESYADAGAIAEESLSNIKTVHMFNAASHFIHKYTKALRKTEVAGIKKNLILGVGTGIMFFVVFCTYAFGLYYGAVKVSNDQINHPCSGYGCYDGGQVLIVFFSVVLSATALGQAGPGAQAIYAARLAAHGVFELIERKSKIDANADSGLKLRRVHGEIALKNITFAYPSRPDVQVCAGYSLHIPAGQKIALVGSSGSGKSTIVSLLERFYDPLQGSVTLDGHNLKDLNIRWLRQQIGLVGQEPCLFQDTIANNIRHGKPGASLEEVYAAAKQANAYDFIMGFPDGFDTEVGDRGAQLSGGQKQRIAIARAIIKNPSILILDEATSALDTESEHIVQASLDHLVATGNRTTIIIAHRLSTIRNADRIAVLHAGNVVEEGTHESLLAIPNGLYKSLVETQVSMEVEVEIQVPVTPIFPEIYSLPSRQGYSDETILSNSHVDMLDLSHKVDDIDDIVTDFSLSRVWRLSKPESCNLVLGSLGAIVNGAIYPLWGTVLTKCTVLLFKLDGGSHMMRQEALMWAVCFVGLGVAFFASITLLNYQFGIASERLTSRVRSLCFEAMLRQEMAWFDDEKHTSGALTTRLATDSAAIRSMTSDTLNSALISISSLLVAFGIAFSQSWQMTLAFLGIFPILAFANVLQVKSMTGDTGKDVNDGDVRAGGLLSEAINSIRTVASFCLEKSIDESYLHWLQLSSATDRNVGLISGIGYGISQSCMFFAIALLFYLGGWLLRNGSITFEQMFLVLNPILLCSISVGMASQGVGDVGKAKKAVQSIFGIIDRIPSIDCSASNGFVLGRVKGEIELRHVAFAYPSRPDNKIYTDYTLTIRAGQTLALVGGSGSGKSTAINLIERFYDPAAGAVYLDGHDLRTLN
ncbi:ATP-binding Cassette (ABC) Superfamily, partial [Thraustotheca clavata]